MEILFSCSNFMHLFLPYGQFQDILHYDEGKFYSFYFLGKPYLIIIVTSYVGHVELRSAHRRAMPKKLLDSMNVTRIFLLAKIPPHEK